MSVLGWFPRAWTRSFTRPLCAMTYAHGSDCRKLWRLRSCSTFESCRRYFLSWHSCRFQILHLQYIDKVINVGCAGPANSSGSVVEETAELPQLQLVELWTGRSHARCVQRLMPMVDVLMQFIDLGDVAVMPQRQVPAVGLDSWDEG